jgi:hypothetical protein
MMSVTDPTINTAALAGAKFIMGPTGSEADPLSSTPNSTQNNQGGALPSGYQASTPDAQGQITYTGNNVTAKLPANGANNNTILTNANTIATDNPGSTVTANPDGSGTITINGVTTTLAPNTFASSSAASSAVGAATTAAGTNAANKTAADAEIQTINDQLAVTLQQLGQEMDAAEGAAGAASGGFGKAGESGAQSRVQQLIDQAKSAAQDQIAQINASLAQTNASVSSSLSTTLAQIEQQAQGVATSALGNAQNTSGSTNLLGITLPNGANWQSVQSNPASVLNAQGLTGNPQIDDLIAQYGKAGVSPAAAMGYIAGQQLAQQKTAVTNAQALMSGILPSVVAGLSDAQIVSQYGTVVSAWQNAGLTQAQAITQIRSGTSTEQKTNLTAYGTPTGATTQTISPAVDPSTTLSTTDANTAGLPGSIAAGTKYTPNAIYQDAIEYAMTGKVPSLGLGTAAQVQQARASINNVAAAIVAAAGQNFPALQALYKADSSAATQSVQRLARIQIVENSAVANFPRLETLADSVKAAGITITESDLQAGSAIVQQRTGSADAAAYVELVNTIRSDYSAMQASLAGSRGGQYFAETAAQAIPLGLTSAQYAAIGSTITLNAQNASTATNGEVSDLLSISGGAGALGTSGNTGGTGTYTIAQGDTFTTIGAANGLSAADIAIANPGVDPNNLQPGQSIVLPPGGGSSTVQPAGTIVIYQGQQYVVGADGNTLTPVGQ